MKSPDSFTRCTARTRACAREATWLRPIPGLRRQDPEHRYVLDRPGQPLHHFPISVTGVLAAGKSAFAMERIQATQHVWAPRGNTVHLALECFLQSRLDELDIIAVDSDYIDWVGPLISHVRWLDVEVIASERPTCCLTRNISGTYDCGFIERATGRRVLADLKTLGENGATYSTAAQLGAYMALDATHGVHWDHGQTIWSRPGQTVFSALYSRSECLSAWGLAWARYRQQRDAQALEPLRIAL
jgi:hypothetical protein